MAVVDFVRSLLDALSGLEEIERVAVQTEGPTVSGRAIFVDGKFLSFFYNQQTGTQAFALIESGNRIWGIDFDKRRGWHCHPFDAPEQHTSLPPQNIKKIISELKKIL